MGRAGHQTYVFERPVGIRVTGVVGGVKEAEGPLAEHFDRLHDDMRVGQKTWEKAERMLLEEAVDVAMRKADLQKEDIPLYIGGDLLEQLTTSNFVAKDLNSMYLGVYSACGTTVEGLLLGAMMVELGVVERVMTGAVSHTFAAEKLYRFPNEYGAQKPPYAQRTVTGAGVAILELGHRPRLEAATIGRVVDTGLKDPFDMGSAEAPAAVATIVAHLRDLDRTLEDYDLVLTGDLARVGLAFAKQLLAEQGYVSTDRIEDCGVLLYRPDQGVFAGGSGAGCSAVVMYGYAVNQMKNRRYRRVLLCGTGALHSPTSVKQGDSIPGICHAVSLSME
ncbi:MAG: stage V sporulation protein AD [Alicyclobacillaceae bacterium]|nr:stage V sporulation protein AD [Alicyclobacillaceae bacterium]